MRIFSFLLSNKEWIFSGVGCLIIGGIFKYLIKEDKGVTQNGCGENITQIGVQNNYYTDNGEKNE